MQSTRRILIFTSVIVLLFSSLAFASDPAPDPEQEPLEVESVPDPWLSLETKTQELRATAKTLDDVYNILNSGLMSGNTPKLDNLYTMVSDNLEYWVNSQKYSIADLQGMTWSLVNSINNQLTSTNSILGNIYNENYTTNRKLEYVFSAIEDTINIKWYTGGINYLGVSTNSGTTYLNSYTTGLNYCYADFNITSDFNDKVPCLLRLFVPVYMSSPSFDGVPPIYITEIRSSSSLVSSASFDTFAISTNGGTYFYIFDFAKRFTGRYTFTLSTRGAGTMTFLHTVAGSAVWIPFDTLDYQIIKTAFNQASSADSDKQSLDQLVSISAQLSSLAQSSQSGSEAAEALADYFVSPQKQAAEDASSQVINSTLNNFTGSGSGAAKSSDSNAMKDVSGSIQSGLNGGGSVSGATGVFNSGSDFWGWFTQQNSNYINNPYPAPTVTPTRGSGDEIVDFLTPNSNELQDLLRQGGDQR